MDQIFDRIFSRAHQSSLSAKAPLFLELLTQALIKRRPVILIVKSSGDYFPRRKNLKFFLQNGGDSLKGMPPDDRSAMHATSADPLVRMERMASRFSLAQGDFPNILLLPPESLVEKCLTIRELQKYAQLLSVNEKIDRGELISSLSLLGYAKVPHVLDRGTFAVRGSIIDIFSNGEPHPIRLDLFGDEIESIKYFDETSQRSFQSIEAITLGPVKEVSLDKDTKNLAREKLVNLADILNYPTQNLNEKLRDIDNGIQFYGMEKLLPAFYHEFSSILELIVATQPKDKLPLIVFDDREAINYEIKQYLQAIGELYQQAIVRGDLLFTQEDYFLSLDSLNKLLGQFDCLDVNSAPGNPSNNFLCRDTTHIREDILKASISITKEEQPHLLKPLADNIKRLHHEKTLTVIVVSSREHEQELRRLLATFHINIGSVNNFSWLLDPQALYRPHVHAYTLISKSPLSFGAIFDFMGLALIAEDDIFGKRTKRKDSSGKKHGFSTAISDLEIDDLVVHVDHGVGQFKGLVRLSVRGVDNDYILINYANAEKLYLPTHRINLIKPHGGSSTQKLDKLGGTAWVTKKKKVKEAVMAMAQDLLKLYAKREIVERPPFFAPDDRYLEFLSNFEFETTHDQQKAIDDVIRDMQEKKPMDRLVCGDVGFGKTEVAMRASMLAVLSNRQVAVLAPTTVLAQQHGITFKERFKNTGVTIGVLSRFQKPKETKKTLSDLQNNQLDIVIGTHRLLSPDVAFHNLGLIVVDEEQRFGIKAKEHLKKMRTKVDVLTMSATPIPRTLQMSYFGIRDLSIIETPPVDRRAIETQVTQFDDAVIIEAILRELGRGGQVYFVHNRVQSIEATALYLANLVPEARIAVAHGQMGEAVLEDVMLRFMSHEINLLVCTTIIETGIDVPTANTMFINNADDFGLSQLYQLRGRIGRSKERAFAYLLINQTRENLSPIARARLDILHKFSELGAGFRIAQHDLELRGAGDLLGKTQHGHMATVGYDLYAELLGEAVKELSGQGEEEMIEPEVVLPISALISEKYCPDLHERMAFYQRLATADTSDAIENIVFDLEDLYGEAPPEVTALKVSALLKLLLKKIHALRLEVTIGKDSSLIVNISLAKSAPIDHQKLLAAMKENKQLRVTPQHKITKTYNIAATSDTILYTCTNTINEIKDSLFCK